MKNLAAQLRGGRHGVALIMVCMAVAIVAVLGLAVLAHADLGGQIAFNQQQAASADALAQSGLAVAAYYIANPLNAPSTNAYKYWPGQTGLNLNFASGGTVDVTVSQVTTGGSTYAVSAVGHSAYGPIGHTIQTQMLANYAAVNYGVASNGSLLMPNNVSVNGNVYVNGTLNMSVLASITGTAYASASGNIQGTITGNGGKVASLPSGGLSMPTSSTIQSYLTYLYYNSSTSTWGIYNAENIANYVPNYSITSVNVPSFHASNPASIYYSNQTVTMSSTAVMNNATLIVQSGNLVLGGGQVSITARSGYPALIVSNGNIVNQSSNTAATFSGVTWLSGGITSSASHTAANINFTGALQFGGTTPSIASNAGNITITYQSSRTSVPNLNTQATSVTPQSWTE